MRSDVREQGQPRQPHSVCKLLDTPYAYSFRNHKSFSCPEASCEYVAKRIDQLKAHIASKHPGIEYSVEAKARKRKSDESSVSESCHAQVIAGL